MVNSGFSQKTEAIRRIQKNQKSHANSLSDVKKLYRSDPAVECAKNACNGRSIVARTPKSEFRPQDPVR